MLGPPLEPEVVARMSVLSGLGRPTTVSRRTGGSLSGVYEVVPPGRAEPVIIKVYDERWVWKQANKIHVYGLLAPVVGWATPAVLDAQGPGNPTGHVYTVLTRRPGRPLLHVAPDLDAQALAAVYREVGALAAAVHEIGQEAFGEIVTDVVDPLSTNAEYMARQFGLRLRAFADAGGPVELAHAVELRVAASAAVFAACAGPVLCHGDLYEGNLLVEEVDGRWRLSGLVDVENAVAADPMLDLAKTDCFSMHGDPVKVEALADGYGPAVRDAADRLALYRIYHTIELWDWFAEIGEHRHLPGLTDQLRRLAA